MKSATQSDKATVVEILRKSFDDNRSINNIVQQDTKRKERIRYLMEYCFEMCMIKGQVLLSDDSMACALILHPERKADFIQNAVLDFKLAIRSVGVANIGKVMKRERLLKSKHPVEPFYYLWFIGVQPDCQGKGIGSKLMEEVFKYYDKNKRPFYLETSVLRNLPWYEKYGFRIINEIDVGYKLYQMIRN